ncbi:putative bifunctional diguanylate cyclase/phosphodiesterase [Pseudohoeflea coraliihabitans]|uniref:EAL domain-containing protein n=1 Tax=Pseudohoeflea coraliihabitans TaxID=2860393 RepID=A0ABS6WK84_9HYPH|nr:EAL domain-containing protein [Pseudohoeflea sp. DP4N28-3]MBW3096367.1 EAL domain-containing protein [Pseudohoeflea sp. DP4N28-3]
MLPTDQSDDAAEVRLSFVKSLYLKRGTLFAGMVAHVVTASAIYVRTQDIFYLYCGLAMICIWAARMGKMLAFDRCDTTRFSMQDTVKWERLYVAGPVAGALVLGIMCAYALVVSRDSFAELASVSITLASMISVVGRNFGSRINVDLMILAACLPLLGGFLVLRDPYMVVLALLLLPLFLTTRSMANGVREFLFNTVMAERKTAQLAERFDIALNNMSHGLFMLNGDGQIEVFNNKAREIFRINPALDLRNRSLKLALRMGARNGILPAESLREISSRLENLLKGRERRALIRFADDTWLEFTSRLRGSQGVVLIFEDVSARIRQEEKILQMARYDTLTGLANRSWFSELVAERLSRNEASDQVALAVFDLDDFKHVNDTMGHIAGDRLLAEVAARLDKQQHDDILISRFGGDEFVIFFAEVPNTSRLDALMARITRAMAGPYQIDGHQLHITVSGGVALSPASGAALDGMQIKADLALYDAKRRDKNRWSLFVESMDQKYTERQKLKNDLREAISTESMSIAYQPIFLPDGSRIMGAEALSRWNHPETGPVSPAVYIPLAEEMGIVTDLTRCMINRAIADCVTWPANRFVSVNLSAHDLASTEIIAVVERALARYGLAPERLYLEITESALVDDPRSVRRILETLRGKGITIAIDDFGTGYSSLSYLDMLPLNKVKIDRSFVANITDDRRKLKLLRGVVTLSRELGLDVVIEGVETEAQLAVLLENDCADLIQGFIFGAPMPANAFIELCNRVGSKAASGTVVNVSATTRRG